MKINQVCILGGTGFVGRHLAARLAGEGRRCRIISRHPQRHQDLMVLPGTQVVQTDSFASGALERHFEGCDAVINLIGILNESGKETSFRKLHIELIDQIVDACRAANVPRLLHMSAINADEGSGSSMYLRTKGEGENRAHTHGGANMAVTSFRPSVIFGSGDSFFNRFANLLKIAPGVFPLACPNSKFAPIFVGDVVEAFARSLENKSTYGKHYELCGPRIFSLKELVKFTASKLGHHTSIWGLGDFASRMQARVMEFVPGKPLSYDNYLSLQCDALCKEDGLGALGIKATDIDTKVPTYLGEQTLQKRYNSLRSAYWDETDVKASNLR